MGKKFENIDFFDVYLECLSNEDLSNEIIQQAFEKFEKIIQEDATNKDEYIREILSQIGEMIDLLEEDAERVIKNLDKNDSKG